MINLFLSLLAGHLIADYWLQPTTWIESKVQNKWKSKHLLFHATVASFLPVIFSFRIDLWWAVLIIFSSHYVIDAIKTYLPNKLVFSFFDQSLHIAILFLIAFLSIHDSIVDLNIYKFWLITVAFIYVTTPAGFFISGFLREIVKTEIKTEMLRVSVWIGIFERILIVLFVLVDKLDAVGFLIAAKSIFWVKDKENSKSYNRDFYLIGTLISFTLAITVGLVLKELLKRIC